MLALASSPPAAAMAISLTAMMAFSRSDLPRGRQLPQWLPWAFLIVLGITSVLFALGHPNALADPSISP